MKLSNFSFIVHGDHWGSSLLIMVNCEGFLTRQWWRCYILCSLRVGLSPWRCLRCALGEARGSGMEETSWVCSLYQCGSSSRRAVSSSIRICQRYKAPVRSHTLKMSLQWLNTNYLHVPHPHKALTLSINAKRPLPFVDMLSFLYIYISTFSVHVGQELDYQDL